MTGAWQTRSPRSVSGAGDRAWRDSALRRLQRAEEKRKLELGRLRGIGPVNGVVFDVGPIGLADRAFGGLGRVGRAHQIAVPLDRVLAFQHEDHDGPRGHEAAEAVEERPLFVHVIEGFGLGLGQPYHLDRDRDQASLLTALDDGPDQVAAHSVRLDDGQCTLNHEGYYTETCRIKKEEGKSTRTHFFGEL